MPFSFSFKNVKENTSLAFSRVEIIHIFIQTFKNTYGTSMLHPRLFYAVKGGDGKGHLALGIMLW